MQSEDDYPTSSIINENSDMVVIPHENNLEECDIQETIEMVTLNRHKMFLLFLFEFP